KIGTVPGSPLAPLVPGASVTLSARQFLMATTVNTVTVSGDGGTCSAQASAAIAAPCVLRYPFASSEPRTAVLFGTSQMVRAFQPGVAGGGERLKVFYNDDHALPVGVRRVIAKTPRRAHVQGYPVSPRSGHRGGPTTPQG